MAGVVDTTSLLVQVFENLGKYSVPDLAFSAEAYVAKSLACLAVDEAQRTGLGTICFSGGVASNEHITREMRKVVEGHGLSFLVHGQIPPGDGGISFGQAIAATSLKQP